MKKAVSEERSHQIFLGAKSSIVHATFWEPEMLAGYQEAERELFGKITKLTGEKILEIPRG